MVFRRGLKSRAESGAKAPHSIWSAAIHRRFLVKALAFTTLALIRIKTEYRSGWNPTLQSMPWKEAFTVPFRDGLRCRGHDKRAPPEHPSEGPACQVRLSTFDHEFCFSGD